MNKQQIKEMNEIRKGLLQGLDRSSANIHYVPEISVGLTMEQIRKGLEKGLDLSSR